LEDKKEEQEHNSPLRNKTFADLGSESKKKAASEVGEREFIESRSVFKKSPVKDSATQWEAPEASNQKVEVKEQDSPVPTVEPAQRVSATRKNERSKESESPLKFS